MSLIQPMKLPWHPARMALHENSQVSEHLHMIFNAPFIPVMFTIVVMVGIMVLFGILFLGQAKIDKSRGKSYDDHSNQ